MKFRLQLPGFQRIPAANERVAEAAPWANNLAAGDYQRFVATVDNLRFDAVTVSEHLAMPYFEVPRLGAYWMNALSVMAFVVGASRRIRVDSQILVLPYHHPLHLAKALATIDVLSGGRLELSVGAGHAVREFEVLGVSFADRGAITDEILDAMLELWRAERPSHSGRFFEISGLAFEPKPVQKPRPPIHVGGNSRPSLRRAARYDGWIPGPSHIAVDEIGPNLDYLRSQPEYAGKENSFDVLWGGNIPRLESPVFASLSGQGLRAYHDQLAERIAELQAIGLTGLAVPKPRTATLDEYLDYLRWFDDEIIPLFRSSAVTA
jgi:probable F420-dependent oxidoreductase